MHECIIQLSERPLAAAEYITENYFDYDHWFMTQIADSVSEIEDRDDVLDAFRTLPERQNRFAGLFVPFKDEFGEGFVLRDGFKQMYFGQRYADFKEALNDLCNNNTLEWFIDPLSRDGVKMLNCMRRLDKAWRDEFGTYVIEDYGDDPITFDDFVRSAKCDKKYYYGGILDYRS